MKHTLFLIACVLSSLHCLAAGPTPWPEHPRPDMQRPAWANLNGKWKFAFDPKDIGLKDGWYESGKARLDREIVVPFPWESKLSGIHDPQYKGVAWYAREIEIPSGKDWEGKDAWLILGACDFETKVWVNGQEADANVGGYLPVEINLAKFAKPGDRAQVVIRVVDTNDSHQPTGKQVNWYTHNGGIWQTVYLEGRNPARIISWQCTPHIQEATVGFHVTLSKTDKKRTLSVMSLDGKFKPVSMWCANDKSEFDLTIKIDEPKLWTPDDPTLYPVTLNLADGEGVLDSIESYCALREISVCKAPGRDYPYICLNGSPIYLRGALHQSFHPDGIYQYPDDKVLKSDYDLCKEIGINMLRIHIKTPIPRELYWADKLGVLIMQDIPCFWKYSKQSQAWYEELMRGAIARDFNHPSIFAWVIFNETWGIEDGGYSPAHQKWVEQMHTLAKELDPTRLVEDNSPCKYDHTVTDINSWHFYINDYEAAKTHIAEVVEKTKPGSTFNFAKGYTQKGEPLMNSEYGGISASLGDQDISWCFKFLTNELRKHDKICGYVYTELSDIEWEHNGFVNYDRTPKEYGYDYWFPGMTLKDLNGPDFVVIDAPPLIELKEGQERDIPILISHWSSREGKQLKLRWSVAFNGITPVIQEGAAHWKPFAVVAQKPIQAKLPLIPPDIYPYPGTGLGALRVELVDGDEVVARNYINVLVDTMSRASIQSFGEDAIALRFQPGDFAEYHWGQQKPPILRGLAAEKVSATGSGYFEYHLRLPDSLTLADAKSVDFSAELAARAGDGKLAWPERKNRGDYPQTDDHKWPTQVKVSINGQPVLFKDSALSKDGKVLVLPDDPADARGAQTHAKQYEPGSYGYQVNGSVAFEEAAKPNDQTLIVRIEVPMQKDGSGGGLSIFGDGLGRYLMDPQCLIRLKHRHQLGSKQPESTAVDQLSDAVQMLIPTAEYHIPFAWRYTVKDPGDSWTQFGFDDSTWKQGSGGFGSRETPNAIVGTRWRTDDIWLRTIVTIDDPTKILEGTWRIFHDEDAQVYLNGQKILDKKGFVSKYEDEPLTPEAIKALRSGKNIIAVHCHQTEGGQNIDLGLSLVRRPKQNKQAQE